VDDQRLGAAFRAVRIRRGWRQGDVAARARASRGVVSLVERGHLEHVSTRALRRIAAALDIRLDITLRLPHGELDRLMNEGHAAMHEQLARYLDGIPGWLHAPEVTFAFYGERGVIDILAFHVPSTSLLVIELKTEFASLEELLATMDVRLRHAAKIGHERGWLVRTVSGWVVFAESATNRRRIHAHAAALGSAFPSDGRALRGWLRRPAGTIRALSFWANSNDTTAKQTVAGRRRVRVSGPPTGSCAISKQR
jgi:transcriptional regulator with XRE-family HTH domain